MFGPWLLIAAGASLAGSSLYFWTQQEQHMPKRISKTEKAAHADYALNVQSTDPPQNSALANIFADSAWSKYADVRDGKIMDWCGIAVAAWLYRGGAIDAVHRRSFWATEGVRSFFSYGKVGRHNRTTLTIGGQNIQQMHQKAGKLRQWTETKALRALPLSQWSILPGDVLLIAHKGQTTGADHIALVYGFDGRTVVTYEGNASGLLANGKKTKSGVVRKARDLQDVNVRNTIFGIGRLSPLDAPAGAGNVA